MSIWDWPVLLEHSDSIDLIGFRGSMDLTVMVSSGGQQRFATRKATEKQGEHRNNLRMMGVLGCSWLLSAFSVYPRIC
jgi:hypothetical protein